jgi:electron transfer flavoprotein alpha subunit
LGQERGAGIPINDQATDLARDRLGSVTNPFDEWALEEALLLKKVTDISKASMLVAIGRGLKSPDNVAVARALADALGASLSGTSQVCDLGWLPRTRHVGKSGAKVRPRAYLSFGISGAPEHLEGIRESELIIACNTDAAAPIFDAAQYGTTADAVELLKALTDRLQQG